MELYDIDSEYCRFLRYYDALVPYNEGEKKRPFIGVVITVHSVAFFAPLTSPKQKHRYMHQQLDFFKIDDGRLGAVNLNNMIPVKQGCYHQLTLTGKDAYTMLMRRQQQWCQHHQAEINTKANQLYRCIALKQAAPDIAARCCDFYRDMLYLKQYCAKNPLFDSLLIQDLMQLGIAIDSITYRCDRFVVYL